MNGKSRTALYVAYTAYAFAALSLLWLVRSIWDINASSSEPAGTVGIGENQLPGVSPELIPIDEAAESQRAAAVEQKYGAVVPGVVQYTTNQLFRDLWPRPALAPWDRSLGIVSALVACGPAAQITYHLDRAMNSDSTQTQASEVLTHLAFLCRLAECLLSDARVQRRFRNSGVCVVRRWRPGVYECQLTGSSHCAD